MHWNHIFGSAILFYFKAFWAVLAYIGAKGYTARKRSSVKPPLWERLLHIAVVLLGLVVVGFLASLGTSNNDGEEFLVQESSTRGAVAFFTLLLPALFGALEGFRTTDKAYTQDPPPEDGGF